MAQNGRVRYLNVQTKNQPFKDATELYGAVWSQNRYKPSLGKEEPVQIRLHGCLMRFLQSKHKTNWQKLQVGMTVFDQFVSKFNRS